MPRRAIARAVAYGRAMHAILLLATLASPAVAAAAPAGAEDGSAAPLHPAVAAATAALRPTVEWLVAAMPDGDRAALTPEFLLAHAAAAHAAWQSAPWHGRVDDALFRDAILPYASVSETRELWLPPLRELALPIVAGVTDPGTAAVRLNQQLFAKVNVRYSTERKRADQSPAESMASGLASCSGLAILLIDACRSVGIPARFVGVPRWTDGSGNHSWVEVWDGARWRFTGAAEPAGDALDAGWFAGRAAGQAHEPPEHAIWAVTWNDSPALFPMVFDRTRPRARAVDVTDRYLAAAAPCAPGHGRVHLSLLDGDGRRVALAVVVRDEQGREVAHGRTRDARYDTNDHLVLELPLGVECSVVAVDGRALGTVALPPPAAAASAVPTVLLRIPAATAASDPSPLAALETFLREQPLAAVAAQPFAQRPLTKPEVAPIRAALVAHHREELRARDGAEFAAQVVTANGVSMRWSSTTFGAKPADGRRLWISLHGGGGAPPAVNDRQWENQKRLYEPAEGVYLAPRAPTDTWDLWHQGHLDPLLTRLIAQQVAFADVDPDRVFVLGYSAGGDGVYQLAPRMADQLAAAAMMAGHPNETQPDGLRNLPFTLHMGGEDHAYDRARVARGWKERLAALAAADPGGYPHEVVIHEGKGHWMDRQDAVALPWMAERVRQRFPTRIVWRQDDVVRTRFYWLTNRAPRAGQRIVASVAGQVVTLEEGGDAESLTVRLDDALLDLDLPVTVRFGGAADAPLLHQGVVPRTIATLVTTLLERDDPAALHSAEVTVALPRPAAEPRR